MRQLGLAVVVLLAAAFASFANSPAEAYEAYGYPWCAQGRIWGYPGDCSFATYEQCLARVAGIDAYCGINPYVVSEPPAPQQLSRPRLHYRR